MRTAANRARWRLAALAVVTLAVLSTSACKPSRQVPCPVATLADEIEDAFTSHPNLVVDPSDPVVSVIIRLPGAAPRGRATIQPSSGMLPHTGVIQSPQDALQTPGRYLAVQNNIDAFAHIVKINAPSYLVNESGGGGAVWGTYVQYEGPSPVISTTVPFKESGRLTLFDVGQGGSVTQVLLEIKLGSSPDKQYSYVLRRAS